MPSFSIFARKTGMKLEKEQIHKLFEDFNNLNILVIGDVMVDSYIWGEVNRISPEAPVPILSATKKEYRLGGAGNVAKNIASLGAVPILCSVIGNDQNANILEQICIESNIKTNYLVKDNQRPTTNKIRTIANQQHLLRIDEEITEMLSSNTQKVFIETFSNAIQNENISAIIIQDYNKGVICPECIAQVISLSKSKNIPLLVDPKKQNFGLYQDLTLLKPNFKELKEALNVEVNKYDINKIKSICLEYLSEKNIGVILLTLSENGIFVCSNGDSFHVSAKKRDISDVSGAGDTVISIASLCVASGLNIYDIAYISNLAGGLVCEKVGVVSVDKEKLLVELTA